MVLLRVIFEQQGDFVDIIGSLTGGDFDNDSAKTIIHSIFSSKLF